MRLLNTWTGQFVEKDPRDPETKYAVLSHTWDSEGEQSYQELKDIQKRYHESVPPRHPQYQHRDSELPSAAHDQDVSSPIPSSPHSLSLPILCPIQSASLPIPSSTTGTALHTPPLQQKVYSPSPFSLQPSYNTPVTISVPFPDHSTNAKSEHIATPTCPIWDDVKLSPKIREACKVARERGYRYMWIDSCCIDKTSSSELSEAINSMYYWYARSEVCYAFLADVSAAEDARRKGSHFRRSRWFTRGWTLQELIAPVHVVFLSKEWTVVGSKGTLADVVIEVTDIDYDALLGLHPPAAFSVAKRFSWASRRQTTRAEDRAYSLLGIFDINMPTLYGEGDRAFRRLQEEIMRRIPDQSLFAWTHLSFDSLPRLATTRRWEKYVCSDHLPDDLQTDGPLAQLHGSLLAPSLDAFIHCGRIRALYHYEVIRRLTQLRAVSASDPQTVTDYDYNFTPHGIRTQFPVIRLANYLPPGANLLCPRTVPISRWYLVILGCEHEDLPGFLLGRIFHTLSSGSDVEFLECGSVSVYSNGQTGPQLVAELFPLAPAILRNFFFLKTMYMDHYPGKANGEFELEVARRQPHEMFVLTLSSRSYDAFDEQGYVAVERGPDAARPGAHFFTFSNRAHSIAFEFQHALGGHPDKQRLTIQGSITLSGPLLDDVAQDLCQADGPSIVTWTDFLPWSRSIGDETVVLRIARNRVMTMQFGIDFVTKDHYSLEVTVSVPLTATTSLDGGLVPPSYLLQSCRTGWEMVKEIPAWLLIFVGAPTMTAMRGEHPITESMDGEPEVGGAAAVRQGMPGELLCDDQSDLSPSQDAVHENADNTYSP